MGLKDDLTGWVDEVFRSQWTTREGTQVLDDDSRLGLKNEAIKITGAVLYADLADSTRMVDGHAATSSSCRLLVLQATGRLQLPGPRLAFCGHRDFDDVVGPTVLTLLTTSAGPPATLMLIDRLLLGLPN